MTLLQRGKVKVISLVLLALRRRLQEEAQASIESSSWALGSGLDLRCWNEEVAVVSIFDETILMVLCLKPGNH